MAKKKLRLYKAERTDRVGWDEVEGQVIVAADEEEALFYANTHYGVWKITEVDMTKPTVVIEAWLNG